MSITRRAITQSRVTAVALVVVILAGIGAYRALPRAMDPGFVIRVAQILTIFPGASPERVEQLVTDKIEKVVQEIPELDFVTSQSKAGVSVVFINIKEKYSDLRPIWDDLRRQVDDVKGDLPDGVIGPTVNDEYGDTFGIVMTITGDGYDYAELKQVADEVRDEALRIGEVAKVDIVGAQEERIFIEYNNARLAQVGISPYQLKQLLESRNIIIPGGEIRATGESITLEPTGNFESVEDLRRTIVQLPGQTQVTYLEDLVDVHRGYIDPPEKKMRFLGAASLALAISLRDGGNISTLGEQVLKLAARLPAQYPHGVDFDFVSFLPEQVDNKVEDFVINVLQSVVIVLGVMLIALGLRTGLLVASLIPTTMVITLFIMSTLDIGLDQMSLASLIIALGMLVDNAIVMTESIMVRMEAGTPPIEAAVRSAKELRMPLLTSSLTTAAAFLPIYLAESTVGEYTAPLFKVVSIALLTSWLLALTMTPLLCVYFLKAKSGGGIVALVRRAMGRHDIERKGEFDSRLYRGYRSILIPMLRFRWLTLAAVIAVFAGVMSQFSRIPQAFFPSDESTHFTATLELPIGTSIERTEAMVAKLEAFMTSDMLANDQRPDGIENWATFVGGGAPKYALSYQPTPPSPEMAFMIVNATSVDAVGALIAKMDVFCRENFPDLEAKIKPPLLGPPVNNPVEVRLLGRDIDELFARADQVKAALRDIPGTRNIVDDWGARTKKLLIEIDQPRAYRAGVTSQDIAVSLLTNLSGFETSQYREEDLVIPIVMRSSAADRSDLGKLESLNIYSQATGRNVPLKQVADARIEFEPAKVFRRNRLRTVTVSAQLEPGTSAAEVNAKLIPWLETESSDWGIGYSYELGGELETSGKANSSINVKMPIAGLIILLLLVAQFNSMRRTLIILFTIPMAMIGVTIGLLGTQSYFGFMTLLGIISLAGIVINNAIVLLERIDIEIGEHGLAAPEAIVEAAQRRFRPILLTTATTIGGLLPLWFSGGAMWEPMAISIIFGLLFSTVLTLGIVPVLYSLLFRVSFSGYAYTPRLGKLGLGGSAGQKPGNDQPGDDEADEEE